MSRPRIPILALALAAACGFAAISSQAAIPWMINYQGQLSDSTGKAVSGSYTLTFRIYDAATSGSKVWEEEQTVTLGASDNGLFNVVLGAVTAMSSVDFNSPLWLALQVADDSEMTPRQRITASGYAINADQLDGLDSTKFLRTDVDAASSGKLTLTKAGASLLVKPSTDPSANTKMIELQNAAGTSKFSVDSEGDVTVAGDLAVTGSISGSSSTTGTTSTTWTVDSDNTSGTEPASGAGLVIEGGSGDASILWDATNDTLDINKAVSISGALDASSLTLATALGPTQGGTGLSSYTTGDILYASAANTLSKLAVGADGKVLKLSGGVPAWGDDSTSGGDLTDVGDCDGPACFTGAEGTVLTFKGSTSGTVALQPAAVAGTTTITMPATTGTLITTGDTGTVTNAMLAGSIAAAKLVGTDIATVGTITSGTWTGTKLGLAYGGTNADLSATGGAGQVLKQASAGAAITVGTIGTGDISGLGTMATQDANNVAITGGSITGITDLAVADGGTGASTASGARTNLGLGTMSTQNANGVAITGGSITGITDLAVADGGTGASTASGARTNLGLVIGTDVQAYNANTSLLGQTIESSEITDATISTADLADGSVTKPKLGELKAGAQGTADKTVAVGAGTVYVNGNTLVTFSASNANFDSGGNCAYTPSASGKYVKAVITLTSAGALSCTAGTEQATSAAAEGEALTYPTDKLPIAEVVLKTTGTSAGAVAVIESTSGSNSYLYADVRPVFNLAQSAGVSSIAKSGSTALTGAVTLTGSGAVTLTQVGQNIDISATASSGDVTDVGDCDGPACFTGAEGTVLTFKGSTSGTVALQPAAVAGTTTITMPATTGTLITTGDTGTVTNAMLAGSIAAAKLVGTDIATVGTITSGTWTGTKLGLAYGGTNADLSATGGANQFLRQSSAGGAVSVGAIADADVPNDITLATTAKSHSFTFGATDLLTIDAAATDTTTTTGVINMDVDSATDTADGIDLNFEATGSTVGATNYAQRIALVQSASVNPRTLYGLDITATDAGGLANTLIGLNVNATTANASDTTYSGIFQGGNVGIGDASPVSLLTVGSGDLFQVNSSGDLVSLKGVAYSWPLSNSAGVLTNNGSGTLTWTADGGGTVTSVGSGAGLTGGPITGNGTLAWDPSTFVNNVSLWDASQASRTLTANLSGAADPVITFGNSSIDVTTGSLKVGGAAVLTSYTETDPVVAAINGIVKSNGSTISAAAAGTDYVAPNAAIVGATKTKVTYDTKGLVTSGADAALASADFANQGTATTLLHGNAAGNPSWGAVGINDVSGSTGTGSFVFGGSPTITTPTINGGITYSGTQPRRTVVLTAGGAIVSPSAGNADQRRADGTNFSYYTLLYDKDTDEHGNWVFQVPDSFVAASDIYVTLVWSVPTTSVSIVGQQVNWEVQTASFTDDDAFQTGSLGAATVINDTLLAKGDLHVTGAGTITAANNTWAPGKIAVVRVNRDADGSAGTDSLADDAQLISVKIEWTAGAESD